MDDDLNLERTIPRVNPIGILERTAGGAAGPRRFSGPMRTLAFLLLLAFAGVTVATTVASLGTYCLTSGGRDPHSLTIFKSSMSKTSVPAGAPLAPR